MSECDTSLNTFDGSLLDLKIGEQTLERITELANLSVSDVSMDAVRGSEAEPLDLSIKDTSNSSFVMNYLNSSNITDETDKLNELRRSVNTILSSTGLQVNESSNDGSYLGVSAKVAEILLQHGEFPASRSISKSEFSNTNENIIMEGNTSPSAFRRFESTNSANGPSQMLNMASLPSLMSWGIGEGESPLGKLVSNVNDINKNSLHSLPGLYNAPKLPWSPTSIPSILLNQRPFSPITPFNHISDNNHNSYNHMALGHENQPLNSNLLHQNTFKRHTENLNDSHNVKHKLKTSPKHSLIQMVALDKSTQAFRSHPLYPLLRDLGTADYYFDHVDFDVAPLLAFLPSSPVDMINAFLEQHPEARQHNKQYDYQSDAIDSVVMDAIHFSHKTLLDRVRKLQMNAVEDINAELAANEEVVEKFCKKFMDVIQSSTPLNISHSSNSLNVLDIPYKNTAEIDKSPESHFQLPKQFSPVYPSKSPQHSPVYPRKSPQHSPVYPRKSPQHPSVYPRKSPQHPSVYPRKSPQHSPVYPRKSPQNTYDLSSDIYDDRRRNNSHHSKEAVKVLTQWLREHCDNPYPNEQEKKGLADMVGLSQQQIASWFINARRRLLPKLRDAIKHKNMP